MTMLAPLRTIADTRIPVEVPFLGFTRNKTTIDHTSITVLAMSANGMTIATMALTIAASNSVVGARRPTFCVAVGDSSAIIFNSLLNVDECLADDPGPVGHDGHPLIKANG
jgi:hypothetical protein